MPTDASTPSEPENVLPDRSLGERIGDLPRSAWFLVAANVVPLIGVVALGWGLADVLLLFWAESAVIGVVTVAKMLALRSWANLFFVPFFAFHYGIFMLVHLVFLVVFFEPSLSGVVSLWPALLGLVGSHVASFVLNFLRGREIETVGVQQLFIAPYPRIVVMQVTIIFGGFAVMALGQPILAILILLALKTAIDLAAHLRERSRASARARASARDGVENI